jgi:GNAT superfamily N-acetyltransferase
LSGSASPGAAPFVLELLGKGHDRQSFSCGVPPLDAYFQRQAGQDARNNVATTFVLVERSGNRIAGFFTLSALSVKLADLPAEVASNLPRYEDVPACLVGRLAVAESFRGQGVGQRLMLAACGRAIAASETVAAWGVIVDAKDERAKSFYERFGFKPFPNRPSRLFLTMKTLREMLQRLDG